MNILAKISSFHQLGLLFAALTATIVTFYISLKCLVWLSVIPAFLNVLIVCFLVNPKHQFEEKISLQKHLFKSLSLFLKKAKLRQYALLEILRNSLSTSVFRVESAYFEQLLPIYMVSIVRILQHATGCLSFHIAAMFKKVNLLKTICFSVLGSSSFRLLGLLMNNTIAPFVIAMQNLFYGPVCSSSVALLQKEYSNSLRATLDSIVGLVGSIGVAIFSFLLGLAADFYSMRIILMSCCLIEIGIAICYRRLWRPVKLKKS